jgi:hypothetical protein
MIKVRSSNSRRQVRTQRSITAFIRGIRTPLNTTVMPAVHHQVTSGLGHPRRARMRGRTEDPDSAAGVSDDKRSDCSTRSRAQAGE